MLETINNSNKTLEQIVLALHNKSKSTFKYRTTSLKRQAKAFSPFYRDFILKVIKNNSLLIRCTNEGGRTIPIYDFDNYIIRNNDIIEINGDGEILTKHKLSKRKRNKVLANVDSVDVLPHELGHAVDFWFGSYNALSKVVILEDNKTLYDIFTEEFDEKHQELYELVMNEYKHIINSNINENAYDILINNIDKYNHLCSIPENMKDKKVLSKRRTIQKELYECGFVETYYQLYEKRCSQLLNNKYSPILDALSSKYDFDGLCLNHHKKGYYFTQYKAVYEFFANLFEAKVTSKHLYFDNLIKHLPKSFAAFEKLFDIFYQRIQSNKRFTDVKLKQEA